MTYDLEKLALKTRKNKTDFLTRFILLALSTLIFLLLAFLSNIDEVKFLSGASLFVILLLLVRLFDKFNPKALFSREIKGENIKEDENEIMRRGSYKGGSLPHRQVGSRTVGTRSGAAPIAPSTRANKKALS